MYFNFACSACGKTLKVREELTGRKARCPYCHSSIAVPDRSPDEGAASAGKAGDAGALPQISVGSGAAAAPGAAKPGAGASRPGVQSRAAGGAKRTANENDDGTNVSMLWTALVGLCATAVFYLLLLPLPSIYFRDLFYERTWVTVAEAFLMFWSIAILVFKYSKLRRQRESMLFNLLPEDVAPDITVDNVDRFASTIRDLPVNAGASFLVRRVLRGLEHFTVRRSASEVSTVMASQSELDSQAVNSSYALLNVFIWAIPILGFIGTVMGLGGAVGSLGVQDTSNLEGIKDQLGAITGGLGTAFDTTLVALIMSLLLKLPASSMQKAEEDLLNGVDEYCSENLLKRLKDGSGESMPEPTEVGRIIKRAIDLNLAEIVEHSRRTVGMMTEQSQSAQKQLTEIVQESSNTAAGAAVSLTEHLKLLEQAVANMNAVLGQLEGKQVVIERAEPPRRRWFGFRSS